MNKIAKEIIDWVYSILISLVFAIMINSFLFQPTRVNGRSMEPTLLDNNYLFVSKIPHTMKKTPEYNEVVIIDSRVFRERTIKDDITDPLNTYLSITGLTDANDFMWVKRVIGKPGDVIEFKAGKVYRNDSLLEEPYIKEAMEYNVDKKVVVPQNHVFIMGDNRSHSSDSRIIGTVPVDQSAQSKKGS